MSTARLRGSLTAASSPSFARRRRDPGLFLIGLALFLVLGDGAPMPAVGSVDLRFGLSGPQAATPWKWLGAVLLIGWVLIGERRTMATMLLTRPRVKDLEWGVYAVGFAMAWAWLGTTVLPLPPGDQATGQVASLGVVGVLVLIVTAAVTEEIAYRGYLTERAGSLLGNRWLGAGLVLAIFVAGHVTFFGPIWLAHHLGSTLAITAVAVLRRNLWVAMLVHGLLNAPILIPLLSAR